MFWKRPDDDSAQLFFAVCIVTVGAFMGGYHWTEIVTEPLLIYPFALFAVFVPVVNLHFFLVFPRANPISQKHRRWVLGGLYGIPTAYLLALWGSMYAARWLALNQDDPQTAAAFQRVAAAWRWAISLWRCSSSGCAFSAWSSATATPARGPSGTRSSGSCWPR